MFLCGGIIEVSSGNLLNGVMENANETKDTAQQHISSLGTKYVCVCVCVEGGVIDTLILPRFLVFLSMIVERTHNFERKELLHKVGPSTEGLQHVKGCKTSERLGCLGTP